MCQVPTARSSNAHAVGVRLARSARTTSQAERGSRKVVTANPWPIWRFERRLPKLSTLARVHHGAVLLIRYGRVVPESGAGTVLSNSTPDESFGQNLRATDQHGHRIGCAMRAIQWHRPAWIDGPANENPPRMAWLDKHARTGRRSTRGKYAVRGELSSRRHQTKSACPLRQRLFSGSAWVV